MSDEEDPSILDQVGDAASRVGHAAYDVAAGSAHMVEAVAEGVPAMFDHRMAHDASIKDDPQAQADWEAAGQAHDQHMHDTVDEALAEFHDAGQQLSGD